MMKLYSQLFAIAFILASMNTLHAQDPADLAQRQKAVVAAEKQLQEARIRVERAAREVADLTGELYGYTTGPMNFVVNSAPRRAMLGINIGGTLQGGKSDGVEVLGVTPDGPADKAGLKAGDIILKIDDVPLADNSGAASSEKLSRYLAGKESGDKVELEYIRDGKTSRLTVETRAMQPPMFTRLNVAPHMNFSTPAPVISGPWNPINVVRMNRWGDMELAELTPGLGKYFGTEKGVLVVKAPTEKTLQLEDGDVILNIDGREPNDPMHALKILQSYDNGESMELQIMRDKRRRKLEVTMPERYEDFPEPANENAMIITPSKGKSLVTIHEIPVDSNKTSATAEHIIIKDAYPGPGI